jgi:hypothetical protein
MPKQKKSRAKVTVTEGVPEVSNATEVRELIREQYLDRQQSFRNSLAERPPKFRSRVKRDNRF